MLISSPSIWVIPLSNVSIPCILLTGMGHNSMIQDPPSRGSSFWHVADSQTVQRNECHSPTLIWSCRCCIISDHSQKSVPASGMPERVYSYSFYYNIASFHHVPQGGWLFHNHFTLLSRMLGQQICTTTPSSVSLFIVINLLLCLIDTLKFTIWRGKHIFYRFWYHMVSGICWGLVIMRGLCASFKEGWLVDLGPRVSVGEEIR